MAVSLGFAGWRAWGLGATGALVGCRTLSARGVAADAILALPEGFEAVALSQRGEIMDDGLKVPGRHDGMAAFPAAAGRVVLVRNHELARRHRSEAAFDASSAPASLRAKAYDRGVDALVALGGTTTVLYDPARRRVEKHFMSLAGTLRNCAGGPTPWGSWISCEEAIALPDGALAERHGYCFEVPATTQGMLPAQPLPGLGRFNHEAIAVDPRSGNVLLTEDRPDGLLYRFVPDQPGRLAAGGRLQALALRDAPGGDTRNWGRGPGIEVGQRLDVRWVDLDDTDPDEDDLRMRGAQEHGAALFARGEGLWVGADGLYFACTNGGSKKYGQIFRYLPAAEASGRPDQLELFYESRSASALRMPDNLTVHPSGDLYVCEDSALGADRLIRIDPQGRAEVFARNVVNGSELAGATFSPDGKLLFVNVQELGITLAISGPF
jgi:secreted PhoX family phosphatase